METVTGGSVLSAAGFLAGSAACGIKSTQGVPDVALLVTEAPACAAGVFTQNRFAAAPVEWDRAILPSERLRAVVVNSGNANACTGQQGRRDVEAAAELAACLLGCEPRQVAVASTGIIGEPLPMERLKEGVRAAHGSLANSEQSARGAERAIMTTDTVPKACAVRVHLGEDSFTVGGMAKGSGMIAPGMATMLAFLTTDARAPGARVAEMLAGAAALTFNRVTVDGDSSTNDTALLLASGESGVVVPQGGPVREAFEDALQHVMGQLARAIVRDGEGATKMVAVTVAGAASESEAERCARAICESQLVKCAIHGGDPNWGRIVCAAGYSGARLRLERVTLELGGVRVFEDGLPTGADAAEELSGEEVTVRLDLGVGHAEVTMWTCDLSGRYVEINSHYHT